MMNKQIMRVSLIKWSWCRKHARSYQNVCYYCAKDWQS